MITNIINELLLSILFEQVSNYISERLFPYFICWQVLFLNKTVIKIGE